MTVVALSYSRRRKESWKTRSKAKRSLKGERKVVTVLSFFPFSVAPKPHSYSLVFALVPLSRFFPPLSLLLALSFLSDSVSNLTTSTPLFSTYHPYTLHCAAMQQSTVFNHLYNYDANCYTALCCSSQSFGALYSDQ